MVRKSIKILGVETNPDNKAFNRYKTNEGNMTSWDDKGANKYLLSFINKWVEVEIEEKPSKDGKVYKNIMQCYGAGQNTSSVQPVPVEHVKIAQQVEQSKQTPPVPMEKDFKVGIKQSSKGHVYFDLSVKGNDLVKIEQNLDDLIAMAKRKCEEINSSLPKEDSQ